MYPRLVALFAFVASLQDPSPSEDWPDQIHLSLASDPAREIRISWHTSKVDGISLVTYGLTAELGQTFEGTVRAAPGGGAGYIREATLTGLAPTTSYFYSCGSSLGGWSSTHSFRTPPVGASNVVIAAYGDQGIDEGAPAVVEAVGAANPDLVLVLGDLAYANGGDMAIWDAWLNLIQPNASRIPHRTVLGNHETTYPRDLAVYLDRFTHPGEERWYAFTVGVIRIIAIDSTSDIAPESPQHAWLSQELAAASQNPDFRWTIVCSHFSPFSSGQEHPEDGEQMRLHAAPLFDQYGVDLVLAAHDHHFERTHPITSTGALTDGAGPAYENPSGIVYVVSGGGGRGLHGFLPDAPTWSAVRGAWYGYSKVSFTSDDTLAFQYVDIDGTVRDQFTIRKSTLVPAPVSEPAGDSKSRCGMLGIEVLLVLVAAALFRRKHAVTLLKRRPPSSRRP